MPKMKNIAFVCFYAAVFLFLFVKKNKVIAFGCKKPWVKNFWSQFLASLENFGLFFFNKKEKMTKIEFGTLWYTLTRLHMWNYRRFWVWLKRVWFDPVWPKNIFGPLNLKKLRKIGIFWNFQKQVFGIFQLFRISKSLSK